MQNVIWNESHFCKKMSFLSKFAQLQRWSTMLKSIAYKKSSKQIIEKYVDAKYMVQVQHIFV